MKHRQWRTNRRFLERADAQRRWDQAYQSLLNWTCCPAQSSVTEGAQTRQEESNEDSRVRPRLDPASDPDANH
jgi:hypothetical protein